MQDLGEHKRRMQCLVTPRAAPRSSREAREAVPLAGPDERPPGLRSSSLDVDR